MNRQERLQIAHVIVTFIMIVALVALTVQVAQLRGPGAQQFTALGVTNLSSLHLSDTGGTATPVFMVNQDGAGVIAEFRDGLTPVVQILDGGSLSLPGSGDLDMGNNRVLNIGVAGTDFDDVGGLTTAGMITITAGGFRVTAGTSNFNAQLVSNLGNAGTDFDEDGGLTVADMITVTAGGLLVSSGTVDLNANLVSNLGNAGTDFDEDGGLTVADMITVTAGGLLVSSGTVDFNSQIVTNLGAAGTDFSPSGGLTIAQALTVTAGGASITSGDVDLTGGRVVNIGNSGTDFDEVGGLTTAGMITVTSGGMEITSGNFDMTDGLILNIGNSGTDFDEDGGLTIADQLTVTVGGILISDGDLAIADDLIAGEQSAIDVTGNDFTIVPTGLYQPLTSGGTRYTSDITVLPVGTMVILTNESATTINITDTSTTMLEGNMAMTQYDTLWLLSDGTNWLEMARSNN